MKLPLTCAQCMQEDIANANIVARVELQDSGRYEVTCPKGHTSITLLQQQKFEILFDIGAYAILDGYYREAVSSFTSALERFYEFFIKVICITNGVGWKNILDGWKDISNQSERQLGAFIFIHLQKLKRKPNLLSGSKIKFRNEVIHKGKIPSRKEAVEYGQTVLGVLCPLLCELKENYSEAVGDVTTYHLNDTQKQSDNKIAVSTICIPTIVSLSTGRPFIKNKNLEDAIASLKR